MQAGAQEGNDSQFSGPVLMVDFFIPQCLQTLKMYESNLGRTAFCLLSQAFVPETQFFKSISVIQELCCKCNKSCWNFTKLYGNVKMNVCYQFVALLMEYLKKFGSVFLLRRVRNPPKMLKYSFSLYPRDRFSKFVAVVCQLFVAQYPPVKS